MITLHELETLANARLKDAQVLIDAGRYDGAAYICGYAIELSLKARICKTLKWSGFPASNSEFQNYQSFKVHNLEVLLHLSGIEDEITINHRTQWSYVSAWIPESRYKATKTTQQDATDMLLAVKTLMEVL